MRVFQLAPVFGSAGGIETYARWLCESLLSRGHQTAIAVGYVAPGVTTRYEVLSTPEIAWHPGGDRRARHSRLLDLVAQFRPDCVVLHHIGDGELLRELKNHYLTIEFVHSFVCSGQKLFRRRDRVCDHPVGLRCLLDWYVGPCGSNGSPRVAINGLRQAREYIQGLALIDLVVVGSQFMKDYLIDEGLRGDQVAIVDMAMGLSPGAPAKSQRTEEPHIVFLGRAVYGKGIHYLIRALRLLDPSYRLTIVGDGWYLDRLKAISKELGLESRVRFLGFLDGSELKMVLDKATIGVLPSIFPEPSGLVVPEMRNHGLPVVVTDVGGLSEWAARDSSVYLASPASASSLAAAIERAVEGKVEDESLALPSWPEQLPVLLEALHAERSNGERPAVTAALGSPVEM